MPQQSHSLCQSAIPLISTALLGMSLGCQLPEDYRIFPTVGGVVGVIFMLITQIAARRRRAAFLASQRQTVEFRLDEQLSTVTRIKEQRPPLGISHLAVLLRGIRL